MPQISRTEAIVLRVFDFRETSRIITAFSRDFGKVKLLAKGIRKPGSRFGASMEIFTHSSIIFYRRETREIYTLSDAHIIHSFDRLKGELGSFAVASPILSFLSTATPIEESNPELFNLTLAALKALEVRNERTVLWGFLVKALALLGYAPEFSMCIGCRKPSSSRVFSIPRGGIVCGECEVNGTELRLSSEVGMILRRLQNEKLSELNGVECSSSQSEEIDNLLSDFIHFHVNLDGPFHLFRESWSFK